MKVTRCLFCDSPLAAALRRGRGPEGRPAGWPPHPGDDDDEKEPSQGQVYAVSVAQVVLGG